MESGIPIRNQPRALLKMLRAIDAIRESGGAPEVIVVHPYFFQRHADLLACICADIFDLYGDDLGETGNDMYQAHYPAIRLHQSYAMPPIEFLLMPDGDDVEQRFPRCHA